MIPNIPIKIKCPLCGLSHSIPIPSQNLLEKSLELLAKIKKEKRIDFDKNLEFANKKFSTDFLYGKALGQMFGMLEGIDKKGKKYYLKAFSGKYNGEWIVEGWAPPLFNIKEWNKIESPIEKEIKNLGNQIEQKKENQNLKKKRKKLSQNLMKTLHTLYEIPTAKGNLYPMTIFFQPQKGIPTGTGDCCAPKLIGWANKLGLKPLGLVEYYIGAPNRSKSKCEGKFYLPCESKCKPILGAFLCHERHLPFQFDHTQPAIIYKDESIVVVSKPSGMLSIPGRKPELKDSVASRICNQFPKAIKQPIVHRLDMETSGVMVIALTKEAHRNLSIQFEKREIEKSYIALIEKEPPKCQGEIKLKFRVDLNNRPLQIYDPINGKEGITRWKIISKKGKTPTRICFTPITGRTHQLRLHAAHPKGLNSAILGDRLYGNETTGTRLMLHSETLSFKHPTTNKKLKFTVPAPF